MGHQSYQEKIIAGRLVIVTIANGRPTSVVCPNVFDEILERKLLTHRPRSLVCQ